MLGYNDSTYILSLRLRKIMGHDQNWLDKEMELLKLQIQNERKQKNDTISPDNIGFSNDLYLVYKYTKSLCYKPSVV
jgi:hypothetical protein